MVNFKKLFSQYFHDATLSVTSNLNPVATGTLKVIADATSNNITITLHNYADVLGKEFTVVRTDNVTNREVIVTGGGLAQDYNISLGGSVRFFARSTGWLVMADYRLEARFIANMLSNGTIDSPATIITGPVNSPTYTISAVQAVLVDRTNYAYPKLLFINFPGETRSVASLPAGNYVIILQPDGTATEFNNAGNPSLSPAQKRQYVQLGSLAVQGGVIVGAVASTPNPQIDVLQRYNDMANFIGPINSIQNPHNIQLKTNLQYILGGGDAISVPAGYGQNKILPDIVSYLTDLNPAPLIVYFRQGINSFSIKSANDPNNYNKIITITAFSDAGGGQTTVTTMGNHGMANGSIVNITDTVNAAGYVGTWTISNAAGSSFRIPTPFVSVGALNLAYSLQAVPNNNFTIQRHLISPLSRLILVYYGNAIYGTAQEAIDANESFEELGFSVFAIPYLDMIIEEGTTQLANNPLQVIIRFKARLR